MPARSRKDDEDPGKPLVLLVDDYADNREAYALYLRFKGYRVEEAEDGHEALERAFQTRPDLIVMDLSLPGLDGWEATRTLKQDRRPRDVPVIALTGHALEGQSESARAAGCDAFITKPCEPNVLEAEIRRILDDAPLGSRIGKRRG
jgi:two-component system, cell cycle response regulator DivK